MQGSVHGMLPILYSIPALAVSHILITTVDAALNATNVAENAQPFRNTWFHHDVNH